MSSADWSVAFLATLRQSANVRDSCKRASVARSVAYERKRTDEAFAAEWQSALDDAVDSLEATAFARARKVSDVLLIFLLKSHRPSVYRDKIEVTQSASRLVIEEEVVDGGNAAAAGYEESPSPPEAV